MIQVNLINAEGVQATLGGVPVIVDRASRTAVLRTARRYEKALESRIQSELDIPKSAIWRSGKYAKLGPKRDWVRVKSKRVKDAGLVWVGYNPIKSGYVGEARVNTWGKLKQFDWGASARTYLFPGAFRAQMQSGHRSLFKREGEKRAMTRGRYKGKVRQPIIEQRVRLDKAPAIARSLMAQTAEWHRDETARQIAMQLAKRLGGKVQR